MPYVMAFHAAPKGAERFHFHVEFQPRVRAKNRLKYLAGVLWALREAGYDLPGARFWIRSTVPPGST